MVDATKKKSEGRNPVDMRHAILFELETVAVEGRQIMYDRLKRLLHSKDIELTPVLFSRYMLDASVNDYLPVLLKDTGRTRLSEDKLASEITEAMTSALARKGVELRPAVKKWLEAGREHNISAGAMSCFEAGPAAELAKRLGLEEMGVRVYSCAADETRMPSMDGWLRLANDVGVPPPMCVAVASSALSCKTALASRMRTVAVLDQFSAFQDFGGADFVTEQLDDLSLDDLFEFAESG